MAGERASGGAEERARDDDQDERHARRGRQNKRTEDGRQRRDARPEEENEARPGPQEEEEEEEAPHKHKQQRDRERFSYQRQQLMSASADRPADTQKSAADEAEPDYEDEHQLDLEEEEEEDEDERHFLIGDGSAPPSRLLAAGADSPSKQSPALSDRQRPMERAGALGRLASYLAAPLASVLSASQRARQHRRQQAAHHHHHHHQQHYQDDDEASLDGISTSDFAFEQQQQQQQWQYADRLPAYYYEAPGEQVRAHAQQPHWPAASKRRASHTPLHQKHQQKQQLLLHSLQRSHARPLLLVMLFLLLIMSSVLLLLRLLALVQNERDRLGVDNNNNDHNHNIDFKSAGSMRQDSVLSRISSKLDKAHRTQLELERRSRWLVASSKCHIPALEPWHASIRQFVHRKAPLDCEQLIRKELESAAAAAAAAASSTTPGPGKAAEADKLAAKLERARAALTETLTYVEDNKLFFTERALALGALVDLSSGASPAPTQPPQLETSAARESPQGDAPKTKTKAATTTPPPPPRRSLATCCFRAIARAPEDDDTLEPANACTPILGQGVFPNASVVEVTCSGLFNYTNVHSFVVPNGEELVALRRLASEKLAAPEQAAQQDPSARRDSAHSNDENHATGANHYNVLMLGVDTISRLNGQRQLNGTLSVLRKLYDSLTFYGYNKVGENTFPNLIPLLTGLKPSQLAEVKCWQPANYTDESERGDDFLDNCKYLWNYYQQVGYLTYFSEDWPAASTMNYLKNGFRNEPTAFYGRPFTLARDKLLWPKFESIGCASCQLDRPVLDVDLANLRAFIEQNNNQLPYFAFHWINCPQHDDLNGASQVDHLLEQFFRDLHARLTRENTFVVFFSDHGYRWGDFVSTRVGHYESSLPLLTIAAPRAFRTRHAQQYANLRAHQNALLTPFDLFKTFVDLRDLGRAKGVPIARDKEPATTATAADANANAVTTTTTSTTSTTTTSSTSTEAPQMSIYLPQPPPSTAAPGAHYMLPEATTTASAAAVPSEPPSDATTTIAEVKLQDGISFKQAFTTLSLLEAHSSAQLDRSCIEAGIPDNYCVCQQFAPVPANRTDVLGAAYHLVYGHLDARLRDHSDLCHALDLERVHHAEAFEFDTEAGASRTTSAAPSTTPAHPANSSAPADEPSEPIDDEQQERRRRRSPQVVVEAGALAGGRRRTTSRPSEERAQEGPEQRQGGASESRLPSREYSIMFSTKPGGGLFQEVVRYYGRNMDLCQAAIRRARKLVEDPLAEFEHRRKGVADMNRVCQFSVHSESLSRFNLYKEQSKCVKSDTELKKICYCNDLLRLAAPIST